MGRVPLARRQLVADWRRLAAAALGVGLALTLILLIDGLWSGIRAQVTVYEDHSGAALYVVAPGTQSLFADASSLPAATVDQVRATPGVAWAAPVRTVYSILDLHGTKVAISLVGSVPGQPGGPWSLRSGRAAAADGEVVVDGVLAGRHHLRVGSTLDVDGAVLRVVGVSRGTAGFMTSFVFVTHHATDLALKAPGTTSVVLVGTTDPSGVRSRLAAAGLSVVDRAGLRRANLQLATHVYGTPLRLMVGVGFAAGALVIALTAFTAVSERRRDYGIVAALGATRARLAGLALAQTFGLAALGSLAAAFMFAAGRAFIQTARPQFLVVLTLTGVARAGGAAAGMAAIAAWLPARRLAKLDPAVAYRSTT